MEFGIWVWSNQVPVGEDLAGRVPNILRWAREAEALGYKHLSIGHHYVAHPYQALQPIPTLARLAGETQSIRLCATILFSLHRPVELAEQLATLDILSGGRVTVCAGPGYREQEFAAFDIDPKTKVSRTIECLEAVRRLWTEEAVTFEGRRFRLDDVHATTKPLQKPHPPLWMAANADVAVERAARLGIPWFVNPHADYDTIARQVALYRKAAREAGHPADIALPVMRELYCAETTEQALLEAAPYVGAKYAAYADWGQDKTISPTEDFRREFAKPHRGTVYHWEPRRLLRMSSLGGRPWVWGLSSCACTGRARRSNFRSRVSGCSASTSSHASARRAPAEAPVEIPMP